MADKNYTSIYGIKDFFLNEVAPKYLNTSEINLSNIGIFGYNTECLGTIAEDSANIASMLFKENFACCAESPETLYLMASVYQISDVFATAANLNFLLLINESDIISKSRTVGEFLEYNIDSNTIINVDKVPFMMDYDIKISSRKTSNGYVHSAYYIVDHKNSISNINTRYIRSKIINYNGTNYIAIGLQLKQVERKEHIETLLSNDKINVCSLEFNFDNQFAGFEVYYTPPGSDKEVQLVKKLANTTKMKSEFCFYSLSDTNKLRISFANDDRYFTPKFNSVIRVEIYTTLGETGNFSKYTGTDINVIATGSKYNENTGMIFIGAVQDESRGGRNKKTLEELRDAVITAQSTVKSISTTSDLDLYFKDLNHSNNNRIKFMKRRDDFAIRLFSAFSLLYDVNKKVMPTNTCNILIERSEIDAVYPETFRSIIKPGRLYTYSDNQLDGNFLRVMDSDKITDDLDKYEDTHVYTNPFLTVIGSKPVNVGMYLNSISSNHVVEFDEVNNKSFVQFLVNDLSLHRNAMMGDNMYTLRISVSAASPVADPFITAIQEDTLIKPTDNVFTNISDNKKYINNGILKTMVFFEDGGNETCFKEFELVGYDGLNYIFEGKLETNDYISMNNKFKVINSLYDIEKNVIYPEKFIPCDNVKINIYTFFKYNTEPNISHKYEQYDIAKGYTLTNKYITESDKLSFIIPLPAIVSNLLYNRFIKEDGTADYNYKIMSVPVIKANYIKDETRFKYFLDTFNTIYKYLDDSLSLLNNNFSIDMKLYNTFGKSINYTIAHTNTKLDKLNVSINFGVRPLFGTDRETMVNEMKDFIEKFTEGEFGDTGNNALYLSNLITDLETKYNSKINHLVFKGINSYDTKVQTLESEVTTDNITEHYNSIQDYVPEYINVDYRISKGVSTPQINIDII